MLQFFSGSGSSSFTTAPTAGHPTFQAGTGLFGGGATPNFQGTSAIGINMAAGYANNLFDFQIAGVSKGSLSSTGAFTVTISVTSPALFADNLQARSGGGSFLSANGTSIFANGRGAASNLIFGIVGLALQTGDLFQAQDSGSVNHLGIANIGTGAAPIWALRVAPVANTASMAQAHVGGASTGKAIQVIDNTGTTIGWLQLLA